MSFFSKLMKVTPARKGQKNFDRARRAEGMGDFTKAKECFEVAAAAYDEHFAALKEKGKDARPSELVMAGMAYTRLGRNHEALKVLDECILLKEIPDAYLYAGLAAAQLNQLDRTIQYWTAYPSWFEQRYIHAEIKDQLRQLREADHDLNAACDAMIQAIYLQDEVNRKQQAKQGKDRVFPRNRGY